MTDTLKPATNATEVAERIVEEIVARLRVELRPLVREAVAEALQAKTATPDRPDQWGIFDIPRLHLPADHPALKIISREEMYGDDER